MPTSVLLAVLAAAGLLALAPALVRRYDATERQVAEREWSTARVLSRTRRRRTLPSRARSAALPIATDGDRDRTIGAAPSVHSGGFVAGPDPAATASLSADTAGHNAADTSGAAGVPPAVNAPADGDRAVARDGAGAPGTPVVGVPSRPVAGPPGRGRTRTARRRSIRRRRRRGPLARLFLTRPLLSRPAAELGADARRRWWRYRRRRVLVTLLTLLVVQLALGAVVPAFFVGAGSTVLLTGAYLVHLRNRALLHARRRREAAHAGAETAARAGRARAAAAARRAAALAARQSALAATLEPEPVPATDVQPDAASHLRGRPYQARAANF